MTIQELLEETNQEMFRQLSMKFHPDRGGDQNVMKEINTAKDASDWKKIKKLFDTHVKGTTQADKKPQTNVADGTEFKEHRSWLRQIEKKHELFVMPVPENGRLDAWIHKETESSFYLRNVSGFKTKESLETAILNKLKEFRIEHFRRRSTPL